MRTHPLVQQQSINLTYFWFTSSFKHRLVFFCTYLWMWHYGSSLLPRCVCLCNLPRNSQHSLQLCTVALCCCVMCTARSLSKTITILYEVPPGCSTTALDYCLRGAVMYKRIHEGFGEFSQTKRFYLFFWWKYVKDWEDLCATVMHLLLCVELGWIIYSSK